MNKAISDNRLGDGSQEGDSKLKIMHNLHQHARRCFLERPDHMHPFCPSFQMVEMDLHFVPVDDLFGSPRDRNPSPDRGHDHEVALRPALEVSDVAIVRENLRP
jgi:hypothetical protein